MKEEYDESGRRENRIIEGRRGGERERENERGVSE